MDIGDFTQGILAKQMGAQCGIGREEKPASHGEQCGITSISTQIEASYNKAGVEIGTCSWIVCFEVVIVLDFSGRLIGGISHHDIIIIGATQMEHEGEGMCGE